MNNSVFVYSSSVPFHAFRYCDVWIGLIVTLKHPKKERVGGGKKNKNGKEERTKGRKKGTKRQQQQQKLEREREKEKKKKNAVLHSLRELISVCYIRKYN